MKKYSKIQATCSYVQLSKVQTNDACTVKLQLQWNNVKLHKRKAFMIYLNEQTVKSTA